MRKHWLRQKLEGQAVLPEEKEKIPEVSKFPILSYTQNRKLLNLGKGSFTLNFDSSFSLSCKSDKKLSEAKARKSKYAFRNKTKNLTSFIVFNFTVYPK